ncbi:MAG: 4-(cytidine 5'-diphospho)-2-C-methyl-D-erythritol kinase [Chloroflexi bacterium]|nr:4-(cytidine 5'-diphospho)-2-C-methyl-D-erythritol kinase [Chloroflexota bacterium]
MGVASSAPEEVVVVAPAKVNLCLEVLGKRGDGYHEIRSVVQTVGLCDLLTLRRADELQVRCRGWHILSRQNLVYRAASLLRERSGCHAGALIELRKAIPVAAGFGGGSSDAAAALIGLSRLWGLSLGPPDLAEAAASLGSDVSFFLEGGTAALAGRGEVVARIATPPGLWFVLAAPWHQQGRKTAALYGRLGPGDFTPGSRTEALCADLLGHDPAAWDLWNVFRPHMESVFSSWGRFEERFRAAARTSVGLSGAGPGLFAICHDREEAEALASAMRAEGQEARAAAGLGPRPGCSPLP